MRTGAWTVLIAVALLLVVAGPLPAAADHPTGRKEAMADAPKDDSPKTREEAAASRPERRGNLTYRERINQITRKPLRKEVPGGPRTPTDRQWQGIRDPRPLIARKRTKPPRAGRTRWDHVKEIARGPIRQPAGGGD